MIDLQEEFETGLAIARQAGEIAMRYYRTGIAFEAKPDDANSSSPANWSAPSPTTAFSARRARRSRRATAAAGSLTPSTGPAISCGAIPHGPT
jgi:hypothetical protein